MRSLKKYFDRKINSKIFFSVVFIFSLVTVLFLANFFANSKTASVAKTGQVEAAARTNVQPQAQVKTTPTPTKQPQSQTPAPVFSGTQLKVPVLYYHYVGNNPNAADLQRNALSISPDKFAEQMKYLKDNGYHTISYDTLYAAFGNPSILPSKPVILTFDDAYIDFYYNAYGILRANGLSATVFVPTGLVGQPAYLTWGMIQEMHSSGLISFGAHSVHHYHLASISPDLAFQEIEQSKKDLQDHLGSNVNYMAYPYGETSSSVVSLVRKAGYVGAIGTWPNKIQSQGTIFNSPRLRISGSMDIASFASLLQ